MNDREKMAEALLARHNFALINPSTLPWNVWLGKLPLKPIVPYGMEGDADKMPHLLPLPPDAPYLQQIADNLIGRPDRLVLYCLIDAPDLSPKGMWAHLYNVLLTRTHLSIYLIPFYDPRVFPHLHRIVPPQQLHALFGPIQTLSFPFQDEWVHYLRPETEPGKPVRLVWWVSAEQRRRIARVMDLREVLDLYQRDVMDSTAWPDYATYVKIMARIEQSMEYAIDRYGLIHAEDYREFAWHALRYGEDFHLHPYLQEVLHALAQASPGKRCGYADALSTLTEENWAALTASHY
jgi:hypothetical protein